MNSLDIALRRYEQIVPQPISVWADMPMGKLRTWIDEELRGVLEDYVAQPSFRSEAAWPVWALKAGANTPERELIDRTSTAITACAKALAHLAGQQMVKRKLGNLPAGDHNSAITVTLGAGSPAPTLPRAVVNSADVEGGTVAIMARNRLELVNTADYFWPEQVFDQLDDGKLVQRGESIVSLNEDLLVPGNFIVRCLRKRARISIATLRSYRDKVLNALRDIKAPYNTARSDLEIAWEEVVSCAAAIETVFGGGDETRVRDACVSLTQLYGALHPNPDLGWLGAGDTSQIRNLDGICLQINGLHNQQFFERIATALSLLRRLPGSDDPKHLAIEEAIATGGLVIIEAKQEAFWERQRINGVRNQQWDFLKSLAVRAKYGGSVEVSDVFGDKAVTPSAMSTARSRLGERLPASLWKLVLPGKLNATYRLHLDAKRIHLLE